MAVVSILVSLESPSPVVHRPRLAALVRSIMADGADHFRTFNLVKGWLAGHAPTAYLAATVQLPSNHGLFQPLQTNYREILEELRLAYQAGLPAGSGDLADARAAMINGNNGTLGLLRQVAGAGHVAVFDTPTAPFDPIARPSV